MSKKAVAGAAVGAGLVLGALALCLASGLRLFTVMSPSMGTVAPVGTLVVAQPQASYQVGDIITFPRGARIYTHRIIAETAGSFTTQGDLNAVADAVPVAAADIIGEAVWTAPALGWLLTGLPWIFVGFLLVYLLTLFGKLPRTWRWSLRISGWTLVICLVAAWLKPWLNIDLLGFRPADSGGGVLMHIVNTGLFPLDAEGTRLLSGQDAVIQVTERNEWGFYRLLPTPALSWLERIVLFCACLVPMFAALLVRPDPDDEDDEDLAASTDHPYRRRLEAALIVGAVVAAVGVLNTTMAHAAVTSRVANSVNTTGGRQWFYCRNALSSLNTNAFFTFYMNTVGSTAGATETDQSGHGRTGRYLANLTKSTDVGCLDDATTSIQFNGASQCLIMNSATNTSQTNPNTFSLEAWFKTSTKSNGRIIGFGSVRDTAIDGSYDRMIYLDKDGRVVFGVYPNQVKIVSTPAGKDYADSQWHHVVATLSTAGQFLYVDGQLAMKNTTVKTGQSYTGYWKVGCGKLLGWQNGDATNYDGPYYFTGQLQYVAVYTTVLNATQVSEHYQAGGLT